MRVLALAAVLSLFACTRTPEGAPPPVAPVRAVESGGLAPGAVGPEVAPLVARADAAIADLQGTLGKRLADRLAEAGTAGAVEVCAGEAQGLTGAVGARHGLSIGRTSLKLRNERNAPRPWVKGWLDRHAGVKAAEASPEVFDLGDRIGVVRPIALAAMCRSCHGAAEAIDPATRALIAERYPTDTAVGFAEGDLRGAFWVEVPKVAAAPVPEDDGGPADD